MNLAPRGGPANFHAARLSRESMSLKTTLNLSILRFGQISCIKGLSGISMLKHGGDDVS
jgi:hypothetical protein